MESRDNITKIEQAEEKLLSERQQLLSIFDCIDEVIYVADLYTYEILYVNPAVQKAFGKTLIGSKCYEEFQGLSVPCEFCTNEIILKQKPEPYKWEYFNPVLKKHFSIIDRIIQWPDGRDVRFELAIDITRHKKAEDMLSESEANYRNIINGMTETVWIVDFDSKIIDVNDVALKQLGYSREEFLSMSIPDIDDNLKTEEIKGLASRMPKDKIQIIETYHTAKDGNKIPVEVRSSIIRYRGKELILCTARNITERRQAEAEREKLQMQLNQSQRMETVGRLAGGIAHDYNNMLSIILGHTELLLKSLNPEDSHYNPLLSIRKATKRSVEITKQLLAFARRLPIVPKVLNLNSVIEGMLKMLRGLIAETIDIVWLPGEELWSIKIDPAQVDQILINLCANAQDAIEGIGKITIETKNVTVDEAYSANYPEFLPGDFVLLAISDNGRGMDKETLKNIFEPFYTTKDIGKGTGLGLSTVYGIVKQNSGFINVYSELGKGSIFEIYLPRNVSETKPMQPTEQKGATITPPGGSETILIVEDEVMVLNMTKMIIESLGYSVLTATKPSEALYLTETHGRRIDLVITDVLMPEMSGLDLAKQIHSLLPKIKFLFMSGYTAEITHRWKFLDKDTHFIHKPFFLNDIAKKVRQILDEK